MDFVKKKSLDIKTTKPFIKNPSCYVFYNFDKLKEKKHFFSFWTKNDTCEDILQKQTKFHPF